MQWRAFVACFRPEGGVEKVSENLGEFLTGDRIESSSYSIYMQHNISCSALCQVCVRVSYLGVGWRIIRCVYGTIDFILAVSGIETPSLVSLVASAGRSEATITTTVRCRRVFLKIFGRVDNSALEATLGCLLCSCALQIGMKQMDLVDTDPDMAGKVNNLQKAIRGDYRHNWIIDNLPAASLTETEVGFCCLGRGLEFVLQVILELYIGSTYWYDSRSTTPCTKRFVQLSCGVRIISSRSWLFLAGLSWKLRSNVLLSWVLCPSWWEGEYLVRGARYLRPWEFLPCSAFVLACLQVADRWLSDFF